MSVSVLSAVPRQLTDATEKLAWLRDTIVEHKPDLLITPQEYFGGVVMMPHQRWFTRDELLPKLTKLATRTATALVVGVCEKQAARNVEALWFITHAGEFLGSINKVALPKYDHVATKGLGWLTPETDLESRFKTFNLCGLELAGIFCWEVFSTVLWAGLGVAKPDLICNCVKFGPNAWPQVKRDANKCSVVTGFGYGGWSEEGGWIDRLKIASLWETRCPIVSSTNSWNLRPISMPICGAWSGLDGQGPNSLWHPTKEDKLKQIPEKVLVDVFNRDAIRGARGNRFAYMAAVGEFPPMSILKYTMMLKMARVEDRVLSGREAASVKTDPRGCGFFGR